MLELCILGILNKGETYAYDLVKQLASATTLVVAEGTVYPLLSRLKAAGLVVARIEESTSGPARKYYSLTKEGRRALAMMTAYWVDVVGSVENLLEGEREDG